MKRAVGVRVWQLLMALLLAMAYGAWHSYGKWHWQMANEMNFNEFFMSESLFFSIVITVNVS